MPPQPAGPLGFDRVLRAAGAARLLTRLPPDLARPYAASAAGLAPAVERAMGASVVANRWARGPGDTLEDRATARARLRRELAAIGPPRPGAVLVRSDVQACYPGIGRAAVAAALPPDHPGTAPLLRTLARIHDRGGIGLPIGPAASAIVANAVLTVGDRAIAAAGVRHVRWVDDVLLIADGPRRALAAFDAWRAALARFGLEINPAKTSFGLDPNTMPGWAGSPWGAGPGVR